MREWADVFLPGPDRRLLERRSLFFIPAALKRCEEAGLTNVYLGSLAATAPIPEPKAGRVAINKVLLLRPVSYESALGFLNVVNHALRQRGARPLERADIVACVFRLKDPSEILAELGLTVAEVAVRCQIPLRVVQAAFGRFRLQFRDAELIWHFLLFAKWFSGKNGPKTEAALTGSAPDFIKCDARQPTLVKELDQGEFVYGWDNLAAAPRSGHYWALDENEAPEATAT